MRELRNGYQEKKILEELSEEERFDAVFAAQRELWRGSFGFNASNYDSEGLSIFKRIPITGHITETDVLEAIWKMEAVLGSIMGINAKTAMRHHLKRKEIADGA